MISSYSLTNYSELHIVKDEKIDFCSIICLHDNNQGPAIGGCRFIEYESTEHAIEDAIRLSLAMSHKAAISNLPHNGGKAVIIRPKHFEIKNREILFKKFAECVHHLNGKYITTIDSGTSQIDMAYINRYTPYVTGCAHTHDSETNPSISTALGVFKGIQSGIQLLYGIQDLSGIHIAIQGVGSVGYRLAKLLFHAGAKLTVCDTNPFLAARCENEFNAVIVAPEKIYEVKCDIFSPCALGGTINQNSIDKLQAKMIAGASNDQLTSSAIADELMKRKILYLPDFVINAGGLIHLALEMRNKNLSEIANEVCLIYDRILNLSDLANRRKITLLEASLHTVKNKITPRI